MATVPEERSGAGSTRAAYRPIFSRLKDSAPFVFYFTMVLIAMAGWFYFIGRLLWQIGVWIVG
jgi:hypothetical protein